MTTYQKINVMYSIFPKFGITTAALAFIAGCSQSAPLLPETTSYLIENSTHGAEHNSVCNHRFTATQRSYQPIFEEKETNTVVKGNSSSELLRSLKAADRYQGQGNTKWSVSWSFDLRRNALGCRIANLETSVNVNYHFPVWPGQLAGNNPILANQWNEYSDALRAHHCKHGKAGIDASLEVGARLRQLRPISSCEVLKQQADDLARSVIGVYKLVESDFIPPDMNDYIK